jgi:hypothetical protein
MNDVNVFVSDGLANIMELERPEIVIESEHGLK